MSTMSTPSLWRDHVLPFALLLGLLAAATFAGDYLLHRFNLVWVGERFELRGLSLPEVEQAVFWDAVALGAMAQWRKLHIPIFIAFAVLALGHIISIFLFWGWT